MPTLSAFHTIKDALANASLLIHLKPEAPTNLMVYVAEVRVGVALHQFIDADWYPKSFFSKMLKPTERKCSAFDRELLALYLAIKHFRHFLEGG